MLDSRISRVDSVVPTIYKVRRNGVLIYPERNGMLGARLKETVEEQGRERKLPGGRENVESQEGGRGRCRESETLCTYIGTYTICRIFIS
jgi:hypothetical protein